jgi:5-(carboxyamino)imidazole ribonucleotide mutase
MTAPQNPDKPDVGIIMGSQSDWPTMERATELLDILGIPYEAKIVSAHRTPARLYDYAREAEGRGLKVIIAGAGGAAHLPGMVASMTLLPVVAVPVTSKSLNGMDSLLSIAQMPPGVAVATQAIGSGGAFNAGLLAAQILSIGDSGLRERLARWREELSDSISEEVVTCT